MFVKSALRRSHYLQCIYVHSVWQEFTEAELGLQKLNRPQAKSAVTNI